MAGIAGIAKAGRREEVDRMLDRIEHRGPAGREIVVTDGATLGAVWPKCQSDVRRLLLDQHTARDSAGEGRWAEIRVADGHLTLSRDALGAAPLYFGCTEQGWMCFASEVKAVMEIAQEACEFVPGDCYDGSQVQRHFTLHEQPPLDLPADAIAKGLHRCLAAAVRRCIHGPTMGCWLSGGLDSSVVAALAAPHVRGMHTFAVGLRDAPDLLYAREVAVFLKTHHHEHVADFDHLLEILPQVIYYLESFDALLVRSSVTNYLVAELASQYVPAVYSGEVADELFAGYGYLKSIPVGELGGELIDITNRLHNTALQRVDRCASAHGLVAHVPFADPEVVDYAVRVPTEYKLRNGVEKWILRKAMDGMLPPRILRRTKSKFWQGTGLGELLSEHAERTIADEEFEQERFLENGWALNSKEELMYYRLFRKHFGTPSQLSWMGRTKGAPTVNNEKVALQGRT